MFFLWLIICAKFQCKHDSSQTFIRTKRLVPVISLKLMLMFPTEPTHATFLNSEICSSLSLLTSPAGVSIDPQNMKFS